MTIPDFGHKITECQGIQLNAKYVVPGLTMPDLMNFYYKAEEEHKSSDDLSGNPSKWGGARGVKAVIDAILSALYKDGNLVQEE